MGIRRPTAHINMLRDRCIMGEATTVSTNVMCYVYMGNIHVHLSLTKLRGGKNSGADLMIHPNYPRMEPPKLRDPVGGCASNLGNWDPREPTRWEEEATHIGKES